MVERYADATLIEAAVNSDGSAEVIYRVDSSDEEMGKAITREMDEHYGVEGRVMSLQEYKKKSFFGFSASDWQMCDWEPEGPKKNWRVPPKDPSLN